MEQRLYDQAMSENCATSLSEIQEVDKQNLLMTYLKASPLHLAAQRGNLEFVKRILHQIPELAQAIDSRRQTPLHLASAEGHIDIVKTLVSANVNMCTSRDLDGRNPLHVAAMNGKVDVLEVLLQAYPHAAQARVDQETILHLCVKHNQVHALQLLLKDPKGQELVNARDAVGNTVSHVAVADTNFEIVKVLCLLRKINLNVKNANGCTALDMLPQSSNRYQVENEKEVFKKLLRERGARSGNDMKGEDWLAKRKDSIIVVAALIATVAFQAVTNPPGSVWQDNSNRHKAGETVMAYNSPDVYDYFIRLNTIAFFGSAGTILLLAGNFEINNRGRILILAINMTISVLAMMCTYAYSVSAMTPGGTRKAYGILSLSLISWIAAMIVGIVIFVLAKGARAQFVNYEANKRRTISESTNTGQTPETTV